MSMYDLIHQLSIYAKGNILFAIVPLVIALYIFFKMVSTGMSLILTQFSNLFQLYTEWETETAESLHPYTRSILENRCPEFALIRTLRRQPQTREIKEQVRRTVQSVIDTLETNETEPVGAAIIRELKNV